MEEHIVPECYFDTVLVKAILNIKKVNHQKSCSKVEFVVKSMDDFAVGIIDKDKKEVDYLKECIAEIVLDGSLVLWKHKTKQHYFIQLVPAVEQWALNAAKEGGVSLKDFGAPNDVAGLKKIIKHETANESVLLKNVCKQLIACRSKPIKTWTAWLQYLYTHNRNADVEAIKQIG